MSDLYNFKLQIIKKQQKKPLKINKKGTFIS